MLRCKGTAGHTRALCCGSVVRYPLGCGPRNGKALSINLETYEGKQILQRYSPNFRETVDFVVRIRQA